MTVTGSSQHGHRPADADGLGPGVAVVAALLAEGAGVAVGALVDGHGSPLAFGGKRRLRGGRLVSATPGGLAAGIGAVLSPAVGNEQVAARRAGGLYR